MLEHYQLAQRQAMPLEAKIAMTKSRLKEWHDAHDGQIYISFSGGKDSTVLLHIARQMYPDIQAVFFNTGLEYPEVVSFINSVDNVLSIRPKLSFLQVIEKYGYPVVSKEVSHKIHQIRTTKSEKLRNKRLHGDEKGNGKLPDKWKFLLDAPFKISSNCCGIMKKNPSKSFEKQSGLAPVVGTMAQDSRLRYSTYLRYGCNSFDASRPMSKPLSFWLEQDIWDYIHKYNVPYSSIYDMGYKNTGCVFCMFGVIQDKCPNNKFQLMEKTHPQLYKYCIEKLGCGQVMDFCGMKYWCEPEQQTNIFNGEQS